MKALLRALLGQSDHFLGTRERSWSTLWGTVRPRPLGTLINGRTTNISQIFGGVRVRFRVRFQVAKVPIFGGFPVENPTKTANLLKALLRGISLSEYGSEGSRVRLRGLSKYGSVAYLVERPTRETQAEQYSDTGLSQIFGGRSGTFPLIKAKDPPPRDQGFY